MTKKYTFGLAPHPDFDDRIVPDSQNSAWDDIGPRNKQVGITQHTMVGTLWGTDKFFRTGIRAAGLTDYGIGGASDGSDDGRILMWNSPRGHGRGTPGNWDYVSPNRSGWANGTTEGLEGDGIAFVRKYGANGVNRFLVSIERSDGGDPYNQPPSAAYTDSFCRLAAYWADQAKIPYDVYPWNPKENLSGYYFHLEFALKGCPHFPITSQVNMFQGRIRTLLREFQTSGGPSPIPDEEDPLADIPKSNYVLDPNLIWPGASTGPVGQLWRSYGESTGIFNPPGQPWNDKQPDGSTIYQFDGGPLISVAKDGKTAGIVVQVK